MLDPPTFSQSRETGAFRVEKDYGKLVQLAVPLLQPDGVLFASTNAYAVLGIAAGELQGLGLFDRIHVADRPAFLTTLSDASRRGCARSVEFRLRQPKLGDEEGRFAWIEMQCKPLDLPGAADGDAAGREVVAIMRDVSKQKTLEQALADARAEAERSNAARR